MVQRRGRRRVLSGISSRGFALLLLLLLLLPSAEMEFFSLARGSGGIVNEPWAMAFAAESGLS